MDGVHSSSFKNIVQGEPVGVSPGVRAKVPLSSRWLCLFLPQLSWLPALPDLLFSTSSTPAT